MHGWQQAGVNMHMSEAEETGDTLAGMTIVVTGTLPTLGRKEAQELIEKMVERRPEASLRKQSLCAGKVKMPGKIN
mgnify:CR=1 FL=1